MSKCEDMTGSNLLKTLFAQNRQMARRAVAQLTDDNRHRRLTADSASAGYLLQHLAESMYPILLHSLGTPMPEGLNLRTLRGTQDEGQAGDAAYISALIEEAYAHTEESLNAQTDAQLAETVETKLWGTLARAEAFGLIMYHNAYHIGQAMLAIKRGQA